MSVQLSEYTLETAPLLGIDPAELKKRARETKFLTVLGLLGEMGIDSMALAGENTGMFPNRAIQTLQPGMFVKDSGGSEQLVISFSSDTPDLVLGRKLPETINTITLVSSELCDSLVTLSEF